jgi:hypothetical protein
MHIYGAVAVVIGWLLGFQLSVQSMPITTKVVSSKSAQARYTQCDKVCQRQVGGCLWVLQFPPPIQLTTTI